MSQRIPVTTQVVKAIIETHCHKCNLAIDRPLSSMGFEADDMMRVNQVIGDRYHHHAKIYSIDSIEDITRILNNNF